MKTTYNFFTQFTGEQTKQGYVNSLSGLSKMLEKAKQTGKNVNGYTESQLSELVVKYTELVK